MTELITCICAHINIHQLLRLRTHFTQCIDNATMTLIYFSGFQAEIVNILSSHEVCSEKHGPALLVLDQHVPDSPPGIRVYP